MVLNYQDHYLYIKIKRLSENAEPDSINLFIKIKGVFSYHPKDTYIITFRPQLNQDWN